MNYAHSTSLNRQKDCSLKTISFLSKNWIKSWVNRNAPNLMKQIKNSFFKASISTKTRKSQAMTLTILWVCLGKSEIWKKSDFPTPEEKDDSMNINLYRLFIYDQVDMHFLDHSHKYFYYTKLFKKPLIIFSSFIFYLITKLNSLALPSYKSIKRFNSRFLKK